MSMVALTAPVILQEAQRRGPRLMTPPRSRHPRFGQSSGKKNACQRLTPCVPFPAVALPAAAGDGDGFFGIPMVLRKLYVAIRPFGAFRFYLPPAASLCATLTNSTRHKIVYDKAIPLMLSLDPKTDSAGTSSECAGSPEAVLPPAAAHRRPPEEAPPALLSGSPGRR